MSKTFQDKVRGNRFKPQPPHLNLSDGKTPEEQEADEAVRHARQDATLAARESGQDSLHTESDEKPA